MRELLNAVGQRLRRRRQELGLTQADLARRADVSTRFLVELEKGEGNISLLRLAGVAAALALPLAELFAGLGPGQPLRVALVGLRGAGKSSVGAALSARLGLPLVELDQRVEERAGMRLSSIFEFQGESAYRALEAQALEALLVQPHGWVLATGGSLVSAPAAWSRLRAEARTIWLSARPASHLQRVLHQGDLRPMAGRPHALAELQQLLAARAPLYGQAELGIDTEERSVEDIAAQIAAWLGGGEPRPGA
jgi:XRE family aerobic/anaerobic benzoate catabolism transcriptional regulator